MYIKQLGALIDSAGEDFWTGDYSPYNPDLLRIKEDLRLLQRGFGLFIVAKVIKRIRNWLQR